MSATEPIDPTHPRPEPAGDPDRSSGPPGGRRRPGPRGPAAPGAGSRAEQKIRDAIARGEFDNLPGAGRPLPEEALRRDEHWWIRQFAEREQTPGSAFLPAALQIRKEVQTLPERIDAFGSETAVRREVQDLNRRIRAEILIPTSSIVLGVGEQDEELAVAQWKAAVARRRAAQVAATPPPGHPAPRRRWWRRWSGRRSPS